MALVPRRRTTAALTAALVAVAVAGLGLGTATVLSGGSAEGTGATSVEVSPSEAAPEREAAPQRQADVVLAFAGEVHLEGSLAGLAGRPRSTLGELTPLLRGADVAMLNLETAIATGGPRAAKELEDPAQRYWFAAPPSVFGLLERSGVDVVTMANNHGADYGRAGVRRALAAARRSQVGLVGVGRGPAQAFAPYRTSVRGTDIAVLGADASPRESDDTVWSVAPGTGVGLASARGGARRLLEAVRSSAAVDDVVVVYLHWGEEGRAASTAGQRRLARDLAAAGADVVVGSHSHALGAAGMRGGTYVGYGLGNFAWYHARQSETGVLRLRVRDGEVVQDAWWPGRIPPGGGTPDALPRREQVAAVRAWRDLRRTTPLEAPSRTARAARDAGAARRAETALPAYVGRVRPVGADLRRRMRGTSHDPATCPVGWERLRLLSMSYVGLDGETHRGRMVVHRDVARDVVAIFEDLYDARFPIQQMRLIDAFGGDDLASMAANNTSGYNCRTVAGQTSWSDHAYGRAVDLNPVQNPYLAPDGVQPPAGRRFVDVDRSPGATARPGVVVRGDVVTRAFARRGWTWGGDWSTPDYQHLSAP